MEANGLGGSIITKKDTIGSIIFGIIFTISGGFYLINLPGIAAWYPLHDELCYLLGFSTFIFGIVMMVIGILQYRDIRKGKVIKGPEGGIVD
jgi:hypothetical protein